MRVAANDLKTRIADAESLFARKEYPAVLRILSAADKQSIRQLSRRDIAGLLLLKGRCRFEMGQYQSALISVKASLRLTRASDEHELFARGKQVMGNTLMLMGRFEEAKCSHLEAFAAFKRTGLSEMLFGTHVNLGLCNFYHGDLTTARRNLEDALTCARKYNSNSEVSLCLRNLSRVLLFTGSFDKALSTLREAEQQVHSTEAVRAHKSLIESMASVFRLQYRTAQTEFAVARKKFEKTRAARESAVCLEYLGLNEYFAGNYRKAKEYYQQVLDMPEPTASAVAQTLRMMADVHIAEGHWDLARATAAKADVAITKISERIELGALWRAYGHIHAHDGNRDEARAFFTKSIELLRQLGARYELALSHCDAGRAQVFSEAERGEHLRIARALFVEMEVPKRVAQVDAVIAEREDVHHFDRKPASKQ